MNGKKPKEVREFLSLFETQNGAKSSYDIFTRANKTNTSSQVLESNNNSSAAAPTLAPPTPSNKNTSSQSSISIEVPIVTLDEGSKEKEKAYRTLAKMKTCVPPRKKAKIPPECFKPHKLQQPPSSKSSSSSSPLPSHSASSRPSNTPQPVVVLKHAPTTTPGKTVPAIATQFINKTKAQLQKHILDQSEEMRHLRARNMALETRNTDQTKAIKELTEEAEKQKKIIEDKEMELSKVVQKLDSVNHSRHTSDGLAEKNRDLVHSNSSLEKKVKLLSETIKALESELQKKQTSKDEGDRLTNLYLEQIRKLESRIITLEEEKKAPQKNMQTHDQAIKQLEGENKMLGKIAEQNKKLIEQAEKKKDELKNILSEKSAELEKKSERIAKLKVEKDDLLNRLNGSEANNLKLANEGQLNKKRAEKAEKGKKEIENSLDEKERVNLQLTKDVESLKQQLENVKVESGEKMKSLEMERERLQKNLFKNEEKNRQLENETVLSKKHMTEMEAEKQELKESNRKKVDQFLDITEKVKSLQQRIKELEVYKAEALKKFVEEQAKFEKRIEEAKEEEKRIGNRLSEKEKIILSMTSDVAELKKSNRLLETEIAKLKQEFVPCLSSTATLTNIGVEDTEVVPYDDDSHNPHPHHHHQEQEKEGEKKDDDKVECITLELANIPSDIIISPLQSPPPPSFPPSPTLNNKDTAEKASASSNTSSNDNLVERVLMAEENLRWIKQQLESRELPSTSSKHRKRNGKTKKDKKSRRSEKKLQEKARKRKRKMKQKRMVESSSDNDSDSDSNSEREKSVISKPEKMELKKQKKKRIKNDEATYALAAAHLQFLKTCTSEDLLRSENSNRLKVCDACKNSYSTKSNLIQHLNTVHTPRKEDKPYQCEVCNTEFTLPTNLRQHIRKYHS